jgi:hypothetical protein
MTTRTRTNDTSSMKDTGTTGQQGTTLTDAATGVASEAGRTLESTAAQGMTKAGETLRQVANAARQASQNLEMEQPQIGRLMSTAADKIDEAATYVTDHEPRQMMDQAQTVARRQPALVVVGGLLTGLVLGRVLRTAGGQTSGQGAYGQDWYAEGYPSGPGSVGTSGVSTGYGTGYGKSYDRATQGVMDNPNYGSTTTTTTDQSFDGGSMSGSAES